MKRKKKKKIKQQNLHPPLKSTPKAKSTPPCTIEPISQLTASKRSQLTVSRIQPSVLRNSIPFCAVPSSKRHEDYFATRLEQRYVVWMDLPALNRFTGRDSMNARVQMDPWTRATGGYVTKCESKEGRRRKERWREGQSVFQPRIMRQKLIVSRCDVYMCVCVCIYRLPCHLSPGVMDTPGLSWHV